MSQHDLTIDNQGFPAFRADLNNALQALGSTQSGTTAPSPTFANQLWYDTTNNQLKIRNEDNDAWITLLTLDQSADSVSQLATAIAVLSAGTAGAPALTTSGDTNTGIFFPAADTIAFTEGGVEAMRIDSSGNVAIGITTASYRLHVRGSTGNGIAYDDGTVVTYVGATGSNLGQLGTITNYPVAFYTNSTERMRIDSSGNVGIGVSAPTRLLHIDGGASATYFQMTNTASGRTNADGFQIAQDGTAVELINRENGYMGFNTNNTERMRITSAGDVAIGKSSANARLTLASSTGSVALSLQPDTSVGTYAYLSTDGTFTYIASSAGTTGIKARFSITAPDNAMTLDANGHFLIGKSSNDFNTAGCQLQTAGEILATRNGTCLSVNRLATDGTLVEFYQAGTNEGTISVSGTTVSYNGGHLSRWAQMLTKPELLKGTVMSNLDEMNEYVDAEGNPVPNEQLNKVKVSDVEGDVNVAGVFVNWSHDEAHNVDEINMAMTGDMIIRIAQGVVVKRGDLLMSAGDGTAKPQGDDIVRNKTVAKVTSNHVTCTYADGSYCVPCVLMAC